jgi:hypothetical protein
MSTSKSHEDEEVFESVSGDGTRWLFLALADDRWAITRNGQRVLVGEGNGLSVDSGIQKFLSISAAGAVAGPLRRQNELLAANPPATMWVKDDTE